MGASPGRAVRRGALGLLALLAASGGCLANGDGSTGVTGIMMTLDSRAGTVLRGASTTVKVTLTRNQGSVFEVSLSVQDLPAGVTATQSPPKVLGTTSQIFVALEAGPAAVPGTYVLTVRAAASGLSDATITYTLQVQ